MFRMTLPDDLYYCATFEVLLKKLQGSLVQDIMTVLSLIRKRNFRFCSGPWTGISGTYKLAPIDNPVYVGYYSIKPILKKIIRVQKPNPRVVLDIKQYKLDMLAKEGEACGLTLKTKTWQSNKELYEFQADAGDSVFLSPSALNSMSASLPAEAPSEELQINNITAFDLQTRRLVSNYYLVSDRWAGLSAIYHWKSKDSHRLKATLADMLKIDKALSELQSEARKLAGTYTLAHIRWRGPNSIYNWIAKDGLKLRTTLAALIAGDNNLKELLAAAQQVIPGIKLLSYYWQGDNFKYAWRHPNGTTFNATFKRLKANTSQLALLQETVQQLDPDVVLLSVLCPIKGGYHWRLPNGDELVATPLKLKKHLKAQKAMQAKAQGAPAKRPYKRKKAASVTETALELA